MDENYYYRGVLANLILVKTGYDRLPPHKKKNPVNAGVVKIVNSLIAETEKRIGVK